MILGLRDKQTGCNPPEYAGVVLGMGVSGCSGSVYFPGLPKRRGPDTVKELSFPLASPSHPQTN